MATDRGSTAAAALLTACERLVAERGFHGVSASEVVRAAGQRNNSAVAYHFGSWEGLLDAVWRRHTAPINEQRERQLADAGGVRSGDLRSLVAIYVKPIVSHLGREKPSYWARFNEQWLAGAPLNVFEPTAPDGASRSYYPPREEVPVLADVLEELIGRLEHLPAEGRGRRVALMARFVITALAAWERDAETGAAQPLEQLEAELVGLALALLLAPAVDRRDA